MKLPAYYYRTNRIFSAWKKYAWLLVPTIALGGLYYNKLGLLLIPIMLTLMVTGFFSGKYWCGNLCPHGSLFDSLLLGRAPNKAIFPVFKSKLLKTAFFIFYMGMFVRRVLKVAGLWGNLLFWDKFGFLMAVNYLMPTLIGLTLALFVNSRAWCTFCPMGTIQQLMYKLGKLTGLNAGTDRKVTIASPTLCNKCGQCARVCPVQLQPYQGFGTGNQFADENCIRCATCVENCPGEVLSLDNAAGARHRQDTTDTTGYDRRQRFNSTIEAVNQLAPDVREYVFRLDEPARLSYQAGDYLLVKIMEQPETFRAYSISSPPGDGTTVRITVKKVSGGYGTDIIFRQFKVGDKVELEGPLGRELTVDPAASRVLLVAGGIGITPFVPLVGELLAKQPNLTDLQLVYGVNRADEFLYDAHFQALAAEDPRFSYRQTVATAGEDWQGNTGLVTDIIGTLDLSGYKVYMCGPRPMVRAVRNYLDRQGVPAADVFAESA